MTVVDGTAPSQTDAISLDIDLKHAPEKMGKAITDPILLSKWLLPFLNMGLKAGSSFTLTAPAQPEWEGPVYCRFVEIDVRKKLSYSWVVGDIDTMVTFTLTPTKTGTRLSLVQTGFKPEQKRNFGGARYGWKMFGAKLVDLMTRRPDGRFKSKPHLN
ncbi:MAG: SRPBCC domain-containing protein [Gemmatimonadaceae bacterium]